ncbi:MAG: triose-phosphate isomerase [Solirubrobacterales bacterium]
MTRRPLISGNWKMNLNHYEAIQTVQQLSYLVPKETLEAVDVSIHPPFTDIRSIQTVIESEDFDFHLGAQHCHWEDSGALTGEVSPAFLAKLNVVFVIVGHSERREIFGETDEMVNHKVAAIQAHGMTPIMCCGETLGERESGETESKVLGQIAVGLAGRTNEQIASLVIAYEPIWAIGTGKTASTEQAQEACAQIRELLAARSPDAAEAVRILYGGSMKPANAGELIAQADVDGGLVGGASLDPADFAAIVGAAGA